MLGGVDALRAYLDVPIVQLRFWMQGHSRPPDSVLLKIADLVADREREGSQERPGSP